MTIVRCSERRKGPGRVKGHRYEVELLDPSGEPEGLVVEFGALPMRVLANRELQAAGKSGGYGFEKFDKSRTGSGPSCGEFQKDKTPQTPPWRSRGFSVCRCFKTLPSSLSVERLHP